MAELTVEKSKEQAVLIQLIGSLIVQLDTDYCSQVANEMIERANRQDSLLVLSRNPAQLAENKLLQLQGQALQGLVDYVELLKKVEQAKTNVRQDRQHYEQISNLFIKSVL